MSKCYTGFVRLTRVRKLMTIETATAPLYAWLEPECNRYREPGVFEFDPGTIFFVSKLKRNVLKTLLSLDSWTEYQNKQNSGDETAITTATPKEAEGEGEREGERSGMIETNSMRKILQSFMLSSYKTVIY